ncbi:MAG: MFS transporter [Alphaproteobacteria bacterium]|nr:MFS transporter [Alphaproteobacteria bacterium]
MRAWSGRSQRAGLWQHPDFLKLWAAQAISAFGSRIGRTVLPAIAILSLDARPDQIGILAALSIAPGALVGLLFGGWVDRSAKRLLLIGTHLARALLLFTVPAAGWFGLLSLPQLYLVAAGVGAATALFQIADNAYLRVLIGRDSLVEGNAKLGATDAVAEIGGPSLAGLLIELVTAPFALLFDVVAYLSAARILGAIRAPEAPYIDADTRPTLVRDLSIGLRSWISNPLARPMLFSFANNSFFGAFFSTLYMVFTLETLGLGPGTVGLLIGIGGVGALLGALGARRAIAALGIGPAIIWLGGVSLLAALLIPLANGPLWLVLLLLAGHQLLGDGFTVAHVIAAESLWQSVLPLGILGRARATLQVLGGVLMPLGALTAGWLGTGWGVRPAVWVGVLGGLLSFVILVASPLLRLRAIPSVAESDSAPG